MYNAQRSDFFLNKDFVIGLIRAEIEQEKLFWEFEKFKSDWEEFLNSSVASDVISDEPVLEKLGDCTLCGDDHDPHNCPDMWWDRAFKHGEV